MYTGYSKYVVLAIAWTSRCHWPWSYLWHRGLMIC